jgi:glycosyltransferase involved in cell wall biosynthesis
MKKRILAILPTTHLYGKERANIEIYNLLKNEGFQIDVIINKNARKEILEYTMNFNCYKVSFPSKENPYLRIINYFRSNIYIFSLILKIRPHVLFINTESNFSYLFIPFIITRKKIIFRVGDTPYIDKKSKLYFYHLCIWKYVILKYVDVIISVSEFIKGKIDILGRHNSKDSVIYSYPPTRISNKKMIEYPKTNFLKIGYLGRMSEEKGIHLLVQAIINIFRERKDVMLYIAGNCRFDPLFMKYLQNILNDCPYRDQILFLDEIDDTKSFFENIDVLCIPSIYE